MSFLDFLRSADEPEAQTKGFRNLPEYLKSGQDASWAGDKTEGRMAHAIRGKSAEYLQKLIEVKDLHLWGRAHMSESHIVLQEFG